MRNPLYRYYPKGRQPRFRLRNPLRVRRVAMNILVEATGRRVPLGVEWRGGTLRINFAPGDPPVVMQDGDTFNLSITGRAPEAS